MQILSRASSLPLSPSFPRSKFHSLIPISPHLSRNLALSFLSQLSVTDNLSSVACVLIPSRDFSLSFYLFSVFFLIPFVFPIPSSARSLFHRGLQFLRDFVFASLSSSLISFPHSLASLLTSSIPFFHICASSDSCTFLSFVPYPKLSFYNLTFSFSLHYSLSVASDSSPYFIFPRSDFVSLVFRFLRSHLLLLTTYLTSSNAHLLSSPIPFFRRVRANLLLSHFIFRSPSFTSSF